MDRPTEFDWDPQKAASNAAKHNLEFQFAVTIFLDTDVVIETTFRAEDGEDRFKAIGRVGDRLYTVVYVMVGQICRIISARRSNAKEDRAYDLR